ncbi:MAG: type VI secretion system tip protein VgrG [Burkholderiaceae bacterium]
MPAERTLPIAAQHREFTVKLNGEAVPREQALQSASVSAAANRIAAAQLSYVDGAAGAGDFPLANKALFAPGAEIEILAGSGAAPQLLFKGVVTGLRLRVREAASALLVVDCRHAAARLTLQRRSAHFFEQSDADAIESLLGAAGIDADVDTTSVTHAQLVQHECSDWDFIVSRASANGLLVFTRAAGLAVSRPALGRPVAQLRYGATLLELDARIDARLQSQAVQVRSWSAADQALRDQDAEAPAFAAPGNFSPDDLAAGAGRASLQLRHTVLDDAEAQALAGAVWQRERLDLASGRAKCIGIAGVLPGDTVTLAGVGDRFNGDVLVSGVRHEFDTVQGWKTHLQFGGVEPEPGLRERLQAHPTAALLGPVAGLQIAVVTDNEDPSGEFRVRVRLPLQVDGDDGLWARVAAPDAGKQRGLFFRPELGDEVLLGFLDDDPRQPVVLGMLHSSALAAPLSPSNDNPQKGYRSRSGIELLFDDEKKSLLLRTPGGNRLLLDDDGGAITLQDQNGNKIVLGSDGITISSASALAFESATGARLEAGSTLDLKAGAALAVEGTASTDIKSGGVVKVAGSAVQLG